MPHRFSSLSLFVTLVSVLALGACDDGPVLTDDDGGVDAALDATTPLDPDAGPRDGGTASDGGETDAETPAIDAGTDGGPPCEALEPDPPASAAGAWAPGFSNPGVGGSFPGVGTFAFGADGAVYAGGNFTSAGYVEASNVAAWDPVDGWRALGDGLPSAVVDLAFGADGSLYAVHAQPDSFTAYRFSRWDGTSWSTFADADDSISAIAVSGDRLYAVGGFATIGGIAHVGVAYHDGTAWQGYAGLAPDRAVQSISVVSDDDLCVGGQFSTLGVVDAHNVACWDGDAWTARSFVPPPAPPFGTAPRWSIFQLDRDPADGALVAGGRFGFEGEDGGSIARWTGSAWELIGDGVVEYGTNDTFGTVAGFAFTPSGLYAGGTFRFANAAEDPQTEVNDVARWDGTRWHPMGGGVFVEGGPGGIGPRRGAIGAVVAGPDGNVWLGGSITRADTMSVGGVVRWDGTYWRGLRATGERYRGVSGNVRALARRGTCEIYVGGELLYAGEVRANAIARYTPETGYEALGDGVLGTVEAIEVTRDGLVYAAGNFVDTSGAGFRNVAVWDGLAWAGLGTVGDPIDSTETVRALAVAEGTDGAPDVIYVGGNITAADGARVTGLARWDGEAWSDFGEGLTGHEIPTIPGSYADPRVTAIVVDPATGDVIVAGSFRAIGRDPLRIETNNIARWDGSAWHAFGDGAGDAESTVLAMTIYDGRVTVARSFVNDDPLRFASWDGAAWQPVGTDAPSFTLPSDLDAIGDTLFVAGNWSDGRHAAVFDGEAWHPLGDGTSDVTAAVLAGVGGAYFGGDYDRAGAYGAGGISFWRYDE